MNHYNTVVLGGGPGGYHAALILKKHGIEVVVIEKNKIGGTCLHEGCIPTKSLLCSAKHATEKTHFDEIVNKKNGDVAKLYKGLISQIKSKEIPVIKSVGRLGHREDKLIILTEDEEIQFDNLILATGSSNVKIDIPGLSEAVLSGKAVYSDGFLNLTSLPRNIAIIGGGVIGLEFASFLSMIGKEVTVLEGKNEILNNLLDEDCASLYKTELAKLNIQIITDAHIEEVDGGNIVYEVNNEYEEKRFDLIIVACGRKANIDGIGLEEAGIAIDKGYVAVNECCKTNISNVYACGDLIGKSMLAHAAYMEAEIIANQIIGKQQKEIDSMIPSVIYSNPEVAFVGKGEDYCKSNNIPYYAKKQSMLFSGRYMIEHGAVPGICKLIFSENGILIGAQMVGNSSSETIFILSDMITNRITNEDIINKCYPHPSFVEIVKEVAM